MKKGIAGTIESNDVKITIETAPKLEIIIESIVFEFYGEQIYQSVVEVLNEYNIKNVKVLVQDKGALDYTLRSRLKTAIERMKNDNES